MRHLEREIEKLKRKLLALSAVVEENLYRAIKAVTEENQLDASAVVRSDDEVDTMEVELEEETLKVMALYQPVAVDLRYLIAILKINNDLERIGDLAVNIGYRARSINSWSIPADAREALGVMAEKSRWMLRSSLEAIVNLDVKLARTICASDTEVDIMNKEMYKRIVELLRTTPQHAEELVRFLFTARNLERIADHATNIAEDVIYLSEGEIVRHGRF